MSVRKYIKHGLVMLIESDANLTTLLVRAGKKQLLAFVDRIFPD